jgi:hypothetical protein
VFGDKPFNRGPDRGHCAINGAPVILWHARSIPALPAHRAASEVPDRREAVDTQRLGEMPVFGTRKARDGRPY